MLLSYFSQHCLTPEGREEDLKKLLMLGYLENPNCNNQLLVIAEKGTRLVKAWDEKLGILKVPSDTISVLSELLDAIAQKVMGARDMLH